MYLRLEDLPLALQEQAKNKLNKYGAQKTSVDGIKFDSRKESERYAELSLLQKAGAISDLELQPRFLLQEAFVCNGERMRKIEYVADFKYRHNNVTIVEDVKGLKTQVYRLKKKLFLYRYRTQIESGEMRFKEV